MLWYVNAQNENGQFGFCPPLGASRRALANLQVALSP